MFWTINIATAHRVGMDILGLLAQHLPRLDFLRMIPFLPNLMYAFFFVGSLEIFQLIQQPAHVLSGHAVNEHLRRVALDGLHRLRQVGGTDDEMQMVIHDDIGIESQSLVIAAKPEGVDDNLKVVLMNEYRYPLHNRRRDKVYVCRPLIIHFVAGTHQFAKQELLFISVPKLELGNKMMARAKRGAQGF